MTHCSSLSAATLACPAAFRVMDRGHGHAQIQLEGVDGRREPVADVRLVHKHAELVVGVGQPLLDALGAGGQGVHRMLKEGEHVVPFRPDCPGA